MRPTQLLKPLFAFLILATLCWIVTHREGPFTALAALSVAWGALYYASGHLDALVRRRALAAAIRHLGFHPDTSRSGDLQRRAHELHSLPAGSKPRIHLFADGSLPGLSHPLAAQIAEFSLRTGSSVRALPFLEAAIPCSPDWPEFQFAKPLLRPCQLDAPDQSAAAAFLTPGLRAWLALTTGQDTWTVKNGFLSLRRAKACNPRDAEQVLACLAEFAPHVAAQTPPPAFARPSRAAA